MKMEDGMKTEISWSEISETLKNYLGLEGSPVAIKLAKNEHGLPEGIEEIDEPQRHCQMVNIARREGRIFYATAKKHQCMGGAWAIGLIELTPSLQTGEFYFKLGKFDSWASCMRTISQIPHVHVPGGNEGPTWATVYAPLESTPFDPHVVLIVAQPRMMLKVAQAALYSLGGRIHSSMAGIQSVCADSVALPYMTGNINFSMGCDGSRKFSGIPDEEMVVGIPGEIVPQIAEAVKIVTGAPGSI
jgi:uncharacterized protein (DUF169 family)